MKCIKKSDEFNDALLMNVKVTNVKSAAVISVYAGNKIALHNTSEQVLKLQKGYCLLGFGHRVHWTYSRS